MDDRQRAAVRERLNHEHPHELILTVDQAAAYADATPQQIRDWKRRGHLQPCAHDGPRRRPLFRGIDVLRAQAEAEQNLARTQTRNLALRHASGPT